MKRLKKKIIPVLLSALIAGSSVFSVYLGASAVPVYAMMEALTTEQIIAAILATLGVSAVAEGFSDSGDSTAAVDAAYSAEYQMLLEHAYGLEAYSDKSDEQINAMIKGWADDWKHGTAVISNEAWSLFQSFASSRYEENKNGGSPGDAGTSVPQKALVFEPGSCFTCYYVGSDGLYYGLVCRSNVALKVCLYHMGTGAYIGFLPVSSSEYLVSSYSLSMHPQDLYFSKVNEVAVPVSGTSYTSGGYKAVSNFVGYETTAANIYDVGSFKSHEQAYDYLGGITEEELKKDEPSDLPANFGIPWLSDGVKDLYDRDTSLGNYDVLGRTGTIDDAGVVTGDRAITLPDAKTLEKVTTGEMSWADYMEKVGAIGIDKADGITADTPIVKDKTDDATGETIKDVYVSAPADGSSFLADLKELFPFCIPFDLIHALKVLSAEPETPYFEIPLSIHTFGIDIDYTFIFDFEQFNAIAKALRTVETLGFIVLLIWVTRDLIKG